MLGVIATIAAIQANAASIVVTSFLEAFASHKPNSEQLCLTKNMSIDKEGHISDAKSGAVLDTIETFNDNQLDMAKHCVADLSPEMRHNTLHCLSWGHSIKHVCGFELPQFGKLLALCLPALIALFPHSDLYAEPNE